MTGELAFRDLETVYDMIAAAIDEAGPELESLLLTKLCLALAHRVGDLSVIEDAVATAARDIRA